jgi:hypothetical protein
MRLLLVIAALGAFLQQTPRPSIVQDGEPHGDPRFLLEPGWEPLLNGKDLSAWKACGGDCPKHEWFTTRSRT